MPLNVSQEALNQVKNAFEVYKVRLNASTLAPSTRNEYIREARLFVQWLAGEYEPPHRTSD